MFSRWWLWKKMVEAAHILKKYICKMPIRGVTYGFHTWKKWYVQSEATKVCEFRAKINAFSCSLISTPSHTFEEKSFSQRFLKKWKTYQKWSGVVSFVSLSIKKTVESRRNNSRRGKTEQDVSLCCAFCRSYFVFHL